jgi:hypothetical protein
MLGQAIAPLARIGGRLEYLTAGSRSSLNEGFDRLQSALKSKDARSATHSLQRVDAFQGDVDAGRDARRDRLSRSFQ